MGAGQKFECKDMGGGGVQNRHFKAEGEGAKFQFTDSVGGGTKTYRTSSEGRDS